MKIGQGKNKGSAFEREVGYKLSLWLSDGKRKDLLCRTVGSGAQFTCSKGGHAGDLRAQDPIAYEFCKRYVIECKHWRDLELIRFLNCQGELFKAMQKVGKEALQTDRDWLLIAKQNNYPAVILSNNCPKPSSGYYHLLFDGTVMMMDFGDFLKLPFPNY